MDALSRVLQKILSQNPELQKGVQEARILELWAPAIGDPIAKHAKAVQLKGKTLFLSVENPVWRHELHSNKRLALEKFNKHLKQTLGNPESGTDYIQDLFFLGNSTERPSKAGKAFPKKPGIKSK